MIITESQLTNLLWKIKGRLLTISHLRKLIGNHPLKALNPIVRLVDKTEDDAGTFFLISVKGWEGYCAIGKREGKYEITRAGLCRSDNNTSLEEKTMECPVVGDSIDELIRCYFDWVIDASR